MSAYPIRLKNGSKTYLIDHEHGLWWSRVDDGHRHASQWRALVVNQVFGSGCARSTRVAPTMTCFDIPRDVVHVDFTSSGRIDAAAANPFWCSEVDALGDTVVRYQRGTFYEHRALWYTKDHGMDILPVAGLFRFNGENLTSHGDQSTDNPFLNYTTKSHNLYVAANGSIMGSVEGVRGHWEISPASRAKEAILEAPFVSITKAARYLSKSFEFSMQRWSPFFRLPIMVVPVWAQACRAGLRTYAQLYSLAVFKTPWFYDATHLDASGLPVTVSLNTSMNCAWGKKPPNGVNLYTDPRDPYYQCYFQPAALRSFPSAEYFVARKTPWWYEHMRGEWAVALWFSEVFTATEAPVTLLLECLTALSDDHGTDGIENQARVAIPQKYSFMDLELRPYVIPEDMGLNISLNSICPVLICPESPTCSLALGVHAVAQYWYIVLPRDRSDEHPRDVPEPRSRTRSVSVRVRDGSAVRRRGGRRVLGDRHDHRRVLSRDQVSSDKSQSYFDSLAVGLSVPGRLFVTYPASAFYLYSQHIDFDNLFDADAVQATVKNITPAFYRGVSLPARRRARDSLDKKADHARSDDDVLQRAGETEQDAHQLSRECHGLPDAHRRRCVQSLHVVRRRAHRGRVRTKQNFGTHGRRVLRNALHAHIQLLE